eukprot:GDKI01038995.1.p1 GENE.GDKI01038995.1~~GDKI01038995.1.p1  ORF type:complete len:556 (-),score=125.99 GDKI01038995.1:241-1908(-)
MDKVPNTTGGVSSKMDETTLRVAQQEMPPALTLLLNEWTVKTLGTRYTHLCVDASSAHPMSAEQCSLMLQGRGVLGRMDHVHKHTNPAAPSHTSDNANRRAAVAHHLRVILSITCEPPPIQQAVDAGAIRTLTDCLEHVQTATDSESGLTDAQLRWCMDAAWALALIASAGTPQQTAAVVNSGAVPLIVSFLTSLLLPDFTEETINTVVNSGAVPFFITLLSFPDTHINTLAVDAIGSIAEHTIHTRDQLLQHGALTRVVTLLNKFEADSDTDQELCLHASNALRKLCQGTPAPPFELLEPALAVLTRLVHNKDEEIVNQTCWILSDLSGSAGDIDVRIEAFMQSGVCSSLADLLGNSSVQIPILTTVSNLVRCENSHIEAILKCGVLKHMHALLSSERRMVRQLVCGIISNVTAGPSEHIEQVFVAGLFAQLINLLETHPEFGIIKDIAQTFANVTLRGTGEQLTRLVELGLIPALVSMLTADNTATLVATLDSIHNIMRVGKEVMGENDAWCRILLECGGVERIEVLQMHARAIVYKKAAALLETFFMTMAED